MSQDSKGVPSSHALVFDNSEKNLSSWLVDSGASYHICSDRKLFVSIWKKHVPVDVSIVDGSKFTEKFEGQVELVFTMSYGKFPVQLHYVLYLPTSNVNLQYYLYLKPF